MEESQENPQAGETQQEQAAEETPVVVESNPVEELEKQLAQARQEAAEFKDKFLRERADMDNFRKRQERNSQERVQREKKALILKILGVMDNVERALVYQETMDRQALQQTLRMLMWQMNEFLKGEGLTPIATVGERLNPYEHEAIELVENSDQPEDTIVEEVLKGYKIGNETLRAARVKVSSGNQTPQQ
ncbi:MAG TPA: nucleotide exchange factor GrpE [Ktedonobacteraceae bacterium]